MSTVPLDRGSGMAFAQCSLLASIIERTNPPPHVDWQTVGAYFTPPENHTPEQKKSIELSNLLTQELVHSDIVVVTAPMWNFSVPSSFKAWVDHVSRVGVTFSISADFFYF